MVLKISETIWTGIRSNYLNTRILLGVPKKTKYQILNTIRIPNYLSHPGTPWNLDLKMLRAGLWGNSCCCWMGSVLRDNTHKRERVHPCNVCDKAFKSLQTPNQHTIWQHSGCKHHHRKSFGNFSIWGQGGGEEMNGSVQLLFWKSFTIGNILCSF